MTMTSSPVRITLTDRDRADLEGPVRRGGLEGTHRPAPVGTSTGVLGRRGGRVQGAGVFAARRAPAAAVAVVVSGPGRGGRGARHHRHFVRVHGAALAGR